MAPVPPDWCPSVCVCVPFLFFPFPQSPSPLLPKRLCRHRMAPTEDPTAGRQRLLASKPRVRTRRAYTHRLLGARDGAAIADDASSGTMRGDLQFGTGLLWCEHGFGPGLRDRCRGGKCARSVWPPGNYRGDWLLHFCWRPFQESDGGGCFSP